MNRSTRGWLLCILTVSLALNLWGIGFGLPEPWHPDELIHRAGEMARNMTLNPHHFPYGSLNYYLLLAVGVPAYLVADVLGLSEPMQKTAVYMAGRALSGLLATGCVVLTFLLSRHLFGPVAGLLAALFLALTMGFVHIAHYATVDIPMLFWLLSSLLMASYAMTGGDRRWYVFAGIFAGCAAGTKYIGGVIILSICAACFLGEYRTRYWNLLYAVIAAIVAYVVVNPPILLSSCEFFDGFIKDNAWNSISVDQDRSLYVNVKWHAYYLYVTMGVVPSFLISISIVYSIFLLRKQEDRKSIVLLYVAILPFAALLLMTHYNSLRYTMPLVPVLLILAAKTVSDLMNAPSRALRWTGCALAVGSVVYSGIYSIASNLEIANDSRYRAVAWIERNVPDGATIEATTYSVSQGGYRGAWLSDRFTLVTRPHMHDGGRLDERVAAVEQSPIWRALHPLYLRYSSFAEAVGLCDDRRPHYVAWYETHLSQVEQASFDRSMSGLQQRAPDFVVVSSFVSEIDETNPEGRFYAELFSEAAGYREVADIQYRAFPVAWLDPRLPFINPTILIYQRQ